MTGNPGRARSPAAAEAAVRRSLERDRELHRFLFALAEAVGEARGTVYLTGGYLRDVATGRPGGDVDIMVAGLSSGMLEEALNALPPADLGIRKVVPAGKHFPVFRIATTWSADYIDIGPARAVGSAHVWDPLTCAVADASQRDFTINAMLYELRAKGDRLDGELIDPFDGIRDLAVRTIRCVRSPEERLREDPLRALRAIRLRAEWKRFAIDPATFRAIRRLGPTLLPTVAADRLIAELLRSLRAAPRGTTEDLRRAGLLRVLLPELTGRKAGAARAERRYEHLERSLRSPIPATVLLANLLVDLSPADAETAARRLRFPNVRRLLATVAELRRLRTPGKMRFPLAETEAILRGQEDAGPFIALYNAMASCDGARGKDLRRFFSHCLKTHVFIRGSDLRKLGYPEGPEREETLRAVRDASLRGSVRNRGQALEEARDRLRPGGASQSPRTE